MTGMEQVLHAVAFGQKFSPIEGVDVDLARGRLKANEEMPWHANARDGQTQAPGYKQINQAKADRITRAPIDHPVQVAVVRIVIVDFVAREPQVVEQIVVDRGENALRCRAEVDALTQVTGVAVEERLVGSHIDVRVLGSGEQPGA